MKLVVIAPRGKMGKLITAVGAERDDVEIVGAVGPAGRDYIGTDAGEAAMTGSKVGAAVVDDIEKVIDKCDAIIDFSTVEESMNVLAAARKHGKALVCGTTGFSAEQKQEFENAAADIPVMLAANTSKLVNLMYKLIEVAAKAVGDETDIEVLDMHDRWKLDAPSGTAKEIGGVLSEALGKDIFKDAVYGREGRCPREEGTVTFHSIRGGDIPSNHIVYFVGMGERLEIAHHSVNWKCFASGAVDAASFLYRQPAGKYTMMDSLGL